MRMRCECWVVGAHMETMLQGMKDELAVMKWELSAEREAADEKLVEKIKLEKVPTFWKKVMISSSGTMRRCV